LERSRPPSGKGGDGSTQEQNYDGKEYHGEEETLQRDFAGGVREAYHGPRRTPATACYTNLVMSRLNGDGARVLHLFVKPGHRMEMRPVAGVTAVQGKGIEGDAAFGRARRQILLVDLQNLTDLGLHPGDVRENVTLEGLSVDRLVPGSHLVVGEALLEITDECTPCDRMDEIQPGMQAQLRGRRGVLARVVRGGFIRLGDSARITPASQGTPESAARGVGTHEGAAP